MEINNLQTHSLHQHCPSIITFFFSLHIYSTHTYQVIWRVSRAQSLAHIPVWLRWRPTVSQGGSESAGRCYHQPVRFPWLPKCGWWRAVWWLLPGAGECWHRSGEPLESPLWTNTKLTKPCTSLCWCEGTKKKKVQKTFQTTMTGKDIQA